MKIAHNISQKKQALIDAKYASELEVGETVGVEASVLGYAGSKEKIISCDIVSIESETLMVLRSEGRGYSPQEIKKTDIVKRWIHDIGANPFTDDHDKARGLAFTLDSILFSLDVFGKKYHSLPDKPWEINGIVVKELNWNPFVYMSDGSKQYYQRGFVWSTEDNQSLIESIYNGIDCGKVLVRKRSWSELTALADAGEKDLAFHDLVDGKQRLNAIKFFLLGAYPDSHGNYYGDLSFEAQHKFTQHQLISYAELSEDTPDSVVIAQFLKLNFAGVPQSKEHLDFVRSIYSSIKR